MLYYKYEGRLFNSNNIFGTQLDHLYRKTKAGLNIHHWNEGTILEVVRILSLIANNVIVVSERSDDKLYDKNLIRVVKFFNGTNFTNQILSVRDMTKEEVMIETEYNKTYLKEHFNYIEFVAEIKDLLT